MAVGKWWQWMDCAWGRLEKCSWRWLLSWSLTHEEGVALQRRRGWRGPWWQRAEWVRCVRMSRIPHNTFREWGNSELPECREKSQKLMRQERLFGARFIQSHCSYPVDTRRPWELPDTLKNRWQEQICFTKTSRLPFKNKSNTCDLQSVLSKMATTIDPLLHILLTTWQHSSHQMVGACIPSPWTWITFLTVSSKQKWITWNATVLLWHLLLECFCHAIRKPSHMERPLVSVHAASQHQLLDITVTLFLDDVSWQLTTKSLQGGMLVRHKVPCPWRGSETGDIGVQEGPGGTRQEYQLSLCKESQDSQTS